MNVIDLFSGPGGWDVGAADLNIRPVGVEWDDAAVATARKAGHDVVQADVGSLDPGAFVRDRFGLVTGDRSIDGLIASPPCQAFSMAGKGAGRAAMDVYKTAIEGMAIGADLDVEKLDAACGDERAHLVLEPLRWALALKPRWCAFEQVPPVLPLWEATAQALRAQGYSTWTGLLTSERYGVPQTRRRAILIASLDQNVGEPPATHRRYISGAVTKKQEESLFAAQEERAVHADDEHLLPWVSMAQALGWEPQDEVGFPRKNDVPGSDSEYRERDLRPASELAFALTEKARSWKRFPQVWVSSRPATTIAGDTRVFQPGGHHTPGSQSQNAIRVTIEDAAVLQSFPADYPWQGTKTKKFQQVGNAIPPLLARAVLKAVIG